MSDLPSVADVPVYGQAWGHEEQRLQWERAVAAALADLVAATPLVVLADDEITGVQFGVSLSVDPDGSNRLGSIDLSTTSNGGEDGAVFAEVGDTRAVVFVGALASQTVPMLQAQNSVGDDIFAVTPTSMMVAVSSGDAAENIAVTVDDSMHALVAYTKPNGDPGVSLEVADTGVVVAVDGNTTLFIDGATRDVAVLTGTGTFTYNGDEVAVVP